MSDDAYRAWAILDGNGRLFKDTYSTRAEAIAAFVRNVDRDAYAAAPGEGVWDKLRLGYRESLSAEDVRAWRRQKRKGRRCVSVIVSIAPWEVRR